jgi:hypothetical protein
MPLLHPKTPTTSHLSDRCKTPTHTKPTHLIHIQSHTSPNETSQFCISFRCWTSYAVVRYIVLLMMGILTLETCWDKEHWINFICVASSWFFALHKFTMHGHMNIKFYDARSHEHQILRCTVTWTSNFTMHSHRNVKFRMHGHINIKFYNACSHEHQLLQCTVTWTSN